MSPLLYFFIVAAAAAAAANAQSQTHLTYFNAWFEEGTTFKYQTTEDRPDLAATWKYYPDDMVGEICYAGVWALHSDQEDYYSDVFDTFVGDDECVQIAAPHKLGSVRLVGVIGQSRLNLYSSAGIERNATTLISDRAIVNTLFESLILVGPKEVQLFHENFYTGKSYCIQPDGGWTEDYYTRIDSMIDTIGVYPGTIRSIRFGCVPDPLMVRVSLPAQSHKKTSSHPVFTRTRTARRVAPQF